MNQEYLDVAHNVIADSFVRHLGSNKTEPQPPIQFVHRYSHNLTPFELIYDVIHKQGGTSYYNLTLYAEGEPLVTCNHLNEVYLSLNSLQALLSNPKTSLYTSDLLERLSSHQNYSKLEVVFLDDVEK